jgi:uncharacterized coiled-coil protein SlyX
MNHILVPEDDTTTDPNELSETVAQQAITIERQRLENRRLTKLVEKGNCINCKKFKSQLSQCRENVWLLEGIAMNKGHNDPNELIAQQARAISKYVSDIAELKRKYKMTDEQEEIIADQSKEIKRLKKLVITNCKTLEDILNDDSDDDADMKEINEIKQRHSL